MAEESVKVVVHEQPPSPPRKVPDRLTVVEYVSHQRAGKSPISYESKFTRNLETTEQPYAREEEATTEWRALNTGWIGECGQLSIVNRAGTLPHKRQPTPEQVAEIKRQVLEVSAQFGEFVWLIPAGESMRGYPSDVKQLFIRSRHGTTPYVLIALPR